MPPRVWLLRIEDILEAAASIEAFVAGMSFDDFCSDKKTIDAVVRNFEVIGEAARHVPEETRGRYPDVPWVDMADMRNVLIHEYFGVDFVTVGGNPRRFAGNRSLAARDTRAESMIAPT